MDFALRKCVTLCNLALNRRICFRKADCPTDFLAFCLFQITYDLYTITRAHKVLQFGSWPK